MKKEGKKYLISERELKEIIQEVSLMEVFNPDDYKDMRGPGDRKAPLPKDYIGGALGLAGGLLGISGSGSSKKNNTTGDSDISFALYKGGGSNADAHEPLKVNATVNWLRNNAHTGTTHWCARYVRMALNAGGLQVPHGMPAPSAKYYMNILPANGWEEIPVNKAGELCDVVVISPCVDDSGHNHPDGHIAMCIGNGVWASDFIQRTMHGLRGNPPPSAVHVFRYKNRV